MGSATSAFSFSAKVYVNDPIVVMVLSTVFPEISVATLRLSGRTTHFPKLSERVSLTLRSKTLSFDVTSIQANECDPVVHLVVYTGTVFPLILSVW